VSSPLVSVVITNHNYGRFLTAALDSALAQTHSPVEVIVVDDGSEDDSRAILNGYAGRVTPLLGPHGGQTASINAGVQRAGGELICLLDADDLLLPGKAAAVVAALASDPQPGDGVLVCHPLLPIDGEGCRLPGVESLPPDAPPANPYEFARAHRYLPFVGAPTSALAFDRILADRLFPLRTAPDVRHGADDLIVRGASLVAEVRWLAEPLSLYRHHGPNAFGGGRTRSRAFHLNQDAFLNERLVAAGREPVIDFFASEYARTFHLRRGDRRSLARLALTVARRDRSPGALAFAARTLLSAAAPAAGPRADRRRAAQQRAPSGAGRRPA
jgi:glycosyltransferase involved in cell wall biosynthesis